MVLHFPQGAGVTDGWDEMANRFYMTFYMQLIHLDSRIWDDGVGNKTVLLPFQTPPEGNKDDLINILLQFKLFHACGH